MGNKLTNIEMVIMLPSSNIKISIQFYVDVLNCTVDNHYKLISCSTNEAVSYCSA